MSTEFRTLNDIVRAFQDIGERHLQIKTFFVGQDFDLGNDTARNSILAVNPISAVLPKTEGGYTSYAVDFTVKVLDLVNKDMSNELEVMSDGLEILKDIVSELNTHPYYIESSFDIIGDVNFEPARGVFDSDLTGWECTLTLEAPNYRFFCGLPMDALNGQTYYPDLFSNIRNSDDTYNTTVIVSETLTLPDITHTDSDLTPVTLPAQTPMVCTPGGGSTPSGIAYDRPILTGQTTSYRTGDDAWNLANGVYDYTPPVYPVSFAALDFNAISPFTTLISNNAFGNKNRFTDINGLQVYGDNYVIDHLTGLGIYRVVTNNTEIWGLMIDRAVASTQNSFTDWRMVNRNELASIQQLTPLLNTLNYSPLNIANNIFSSTTYTVTTSAFRMVNSGGELRQQSKANTSQYLLLVRNHYT